MNARTLSTALTLLVTGTATATAQQAPAMPAATIDSAQAVDRIQRIVEAMAAADSIEGRREAIMSRLRGIGLDPQLEWFDPPPSARGAYRGARARFLPPTNSRRSSTVGIAASVWRPRSPCRRCGAEA